MGKVDAAALKRAGLPVDLDRLTVEGDAWLGDEQRLALKKHGVCSQGQPGVFMIRIRTSGGAVDAAAARGLADLAEQRGGGWIHLTTRQQVELHHVAARDVTSVLAAVDRLGLTTSSTCGHTLRGVMSCPDAGASLDEPFDCYPDARATSDSIMARTPQLNYRLPQRVNMAFGGCRSCRDHARTNEAGFVSTVGADGTLGYELWLGGSLGKSAPVLAERALEFAPRTHVLAAANALVDVFVEHGNFEQPTRARLKYLIGDVGFNDFLELFDEAYRRRRTEAWPAPVPVTGPDPARHAEVLAQVPPGGWSSGVRPQRTPGRALVTVTVPLGDLDSADLRTLADLAEEVGDGRLYLTRNQNAMLRDVPLASVPRVRARLAEAALDVVGADQSSDVRVCTGGPVCSLAITPATAVGAELLTSPAVRRNTGLRIHVSGCNNGCAQHQIADLGFSGSKITIGGRPTLGYQVWVGGDPGAGRVGSVVGRVAHTDVVAIAEAVVGVWEALRTAGETLPQLVERLAADPLASHIAAVFSGRWEPGPEPDPAHLPGPAID
ncbi:MAG: nitrite/sulfite reductase, partial [Actinomycetota bacterium]|nr:nitrite/sulfite reductase [Actinomycetota bacterium]